MSSSSLPNRRSRILVVDDEPFNRELLVQELDMYDVEEAANGEEALEKIAAAPPDLVLLDVMMPGIDGYEVCTRLKSDDDTRFIPVVIMTALDRVEDRIRGIDAGADDFLTKPVDNRELMARIRTALRAKHSLDRKLDLASGADRRATPVPVPGGIRACAYCGAVYSVELPKCVLDGQPLAFHARDPLIGRRIDRYDVLDRAGSGGMGCVYVASHATLKRQRYAIKVPFGELAVEATHAERFFREAEACAALDHPHVVSVLDFGTTPEGLTYMVMEFLDGKSLKSILEKSGSLPAVRVATIARQMASGLAHAHARGLVHRDIKPANVMVLDHDGDDLAKLLDFGVAGSLAQGDRHTRNDVRVGTPLYMAPEQLERGEIGPSCDLYALGVTMYEMVVGAPPYTGDPIKVYADKLSGPPAPLATSTGFEALVASLLAPDPADRPPTARAVIEAIDDIVDGLGGIPRRRSYTADSMPALRKLPSPTSPPAMAEAPTLKPGLVKKPD